MSTTAPTARTRHHEHDSTDSTDSDYLSLRRDLMDIHSMTIKRFQDLERQVYLISTDLERLRSALDQKIKHVEQQIDDQATDSGGDLDNLEDRVKAVERLFGITNKFHNVR